MNNIVEDFLLLAAGGIVGLAAGAALCSDDEDEEDEEETEELMAKGSSPEELLKNIPQAANSALASCKTGEERESVRTAIRASLTLLAARLAECGIVMADGAMEDVLPATMTAEQQPEPKESFVNADAKAVQQMIEKLGTALEEKRADVHPATKTLTVDGAPA